MTMASRKALVGGGGRRCWGRFLGHRLILRLRTRGLTRWRRSGSTSSPTSATKSAHQRCRPAPSCASLGTSGNRQRRIFNVPVNDSRRGSSPCTLAASPISARTAKCASSSPSISCTPRRLAAQHRPLLLVRFQLVDGPLLLPPLVVQHDQFL